MPSVPIEPRRPRVLAMSFGFSMAIMVALVVVLFASGGTAEATSYAITSSGGPIKDWNTATTWTPNGVPGSAPGDTVNITTSNAQVQLTTGLANPLAGMSLSGSSIVVEVAGGNLSLAGPSTVGSFSTLRTISGGTVFINGTSLTIGANGLLQSLGGTLDGGGSGTLTIQATGQLTVGTAPATATNGLNIINTGGNIVINGATLAINSNAFITNTTGTIELQSTSGITSDNVGTKIDINGGTLSKSTVAGTVVVALPVNTLAAGTISSSNGTLTLSQGGTHTGTFSASPGTIEFSGGTHQFSGTPTFSGAGAFVVSGGTFDLDAASTIPATASFTQSGGLLTGAGDLTVNGPFTWSGGLIDGSSGSGATNIMATLNITGAGQKDYSTRTINNSGTTTWTGGNIRTDFGGVFNNTGTFDIQCDRFLFWGFAGMPLTFNNSGTVTKSTTFGTSTIGMDYNQTAGSTTVTTGIFYFNNRFGSYTGGTVSAAAGARLNFGSGDAHTFAAGSTLSGAGTIGFMAGVVFVNGTYNVTGVTDIFGGTARFESAATTNQLTLSSGTLGGAGTLTVTGAATWSGFGSMSGAGGVTTFQAGSTLTISSVQDKTHIFRTINNAGTVTWSGGNINAGLGATFNNTGTFNIQSDNSYPQNQGGTLSVFNNSGTITKSVTAGTTTLNVAYNQLAGSTTVSSGQLTLSNGGSSTGVIAVTNTANQVNITSGTYTMNAGTSVTGNGFIAVSGAATQLTAGAPITIPRIALLNGTIAGANLTIANALLWQGGRFLGPGTTTMSIGSTVDHTAATLPTSLDARTFTSTGTFNYTPNANFLTFTNGATYNNNLGGSFNILGNGQIGNGAGSNSFINASTVVKSGGAGGTTFNVPVTNTNAIGVTAANGTLIFANGGSMSAGALTAGASANVHFFGGTFTITGGSLSGTSGTIAVLGSGQLNIAANVFSTTNFSVQSGGTVDVASGRVFSLDNLSWTGGTIQGPGQTRVTISGVIGNTSPTTLAGGNSLTIDGTLNYDADSTNYLTLSGNSQLAVFGTGTMNLRADGIIGGVTPASITNAGILQKTLGSGTSRIDPQFISTGGTVGATTGTLHLKTGGGGLTSTTINTGGSAKVEFDGIYSINAGSIVTGTGTVQITAGALTITPNVTITTLLMNGGTLAGAGAVNLSGTASPSQWLGGTITGSGALTLGAGATFQINGANAAMLLDGRTLNSSGTINYSSPLNALSLANASSIVSGGPFNVSVATPINVGAGGGTIQNNGTFARITAAGSGTIAPAFTNANIVSLQAGTTTFNSFTQSAGALNLAGGNMASGATVTIASGNVTGAGTIAASLSNGGTILPGAGLVTGIITLSGAYTQTGTGKLELDLAGSTPGTYDVLSTTGQPALAGELKINLISGFVPTNGDTFNILGYNTTPATDFTTNTLPTFGAGGFFNKSYLPAMLQLAAAVPTADVAVSQTTSGPANTNDTVTFTVTVTNTDTAFTANGVSLTNTFSGPFTFLTSSTTLGSCTGTSCNLGNLAPGGSAVITLTGTATGPGTISNSASSSSSTPDPNSTNNLGIVASITVSPRADVTVTITDAPDPVNASSNITYTVSVNNLGPNSATSAAVALTVTNGSISTATSGAFTCSGSGASASCTAGTLATGVSTITVTVQAGAQGTTVLGVSYTSSTFDNNVADNTASQSTAITPQGDLGIVKSGPASATPGPIVYTVTVTNAGPSDAASVTVADATPAGLTFVSNSGACTTSYPCSLGTILAGATATITSTYTIASNASIPITNIATVSSTTADPGTANNSSSVTTTITPMADVKVIKSGPASVPPASIIPYSITVQNNGPSDAANVTVTDPTPAQTTLVSVSGACTAFPCSLGTLTNGQSVSINASYQLQPNATGPSITNTASATTSTPDSNGTNNSSSVSTAFSCSGSAPSIFIPENDAVGVSTSGLLLWDESGAESYNVYLGPANANGCSMPLASSSIPSVPYAGLLPNTKYSWRVEAVASNCPLFTSACVTFTTGANCNATITLVKPVGGTTASPIEFEWQAVSGASEYTVFARTGSGSFVEIGKSSSTKLTASLVTDGTTQWYVATSVAGCGVIQSEPATFTLCNRPDPPLARLVGEVTSSRNYRVEWDSVPNAIRYEVDESNNPDFIGATTESTTTNFVQFKHDAATTPLAFYYRVRAFSACSPASGDNSLTTRIVIIPLPSGREQNPSASIPAGSQEIVIQRVFIPGEPGCRGCNSCRYTIRGSCST